MAKRRKKVATKTRTITRTVAGPSKPVTIKVAQPTHLAARASKKVRRVRHHAIGGAKKFFGMTQNQLVAIGGAAALGFLQKQGVTAKLPKIAGLSSTVTAGILAWAGGKFLKSPMLDHVSTGMLSVAAFGFTSGQTVNGDVMGELPQGTAVAFDDDVHGEYDAAGYEADGDDD